MRTALNAFRATESGDRIAGLFLLASLLVGLLALTTLVVSGALPAFSASLRGSLAEKAPYADLFRWLLLLRAWIGSAFRVGYVVHLLAVAAFGWGILRGGLLSPGVGWAAIGWSVLWLVGYVAGADSPTSSSVRSRYLSWVVRYRR